MNVIIIGASSGIGRQLAMHYLATGHNVGMTARRIDKLNEIKEGYPDHAYCREMDVTNNDAPDVLLELIKEMSGMYRIIICAGIGSQNPSLEPKIEMDTVFTNVVGLTQISDCAYNYFKNAGTPGHIAVISSIAGIKGLRHAPAYSATKRYQTQYISCLAQKAHKEKLPIRFTTIKPGFIRTELLKINRYPLSVSVEKGAALIYKAINRERRQSILPGRWRFIVMLWLMIPNRIWERL